MPKKQPKKRKSISQLIRKFNFKKKIDGKYYDQIEHTPSRNKALNLKKRAIDSTYNAKVRKHKIVGDLHYDVYVRKKKTKQTKIPVKITTKRNNLPIRKTKQVKISGY